MLHRIGRLQLWRKLIRRVQKVKFCALNKRGCNSTRLNSNSHHHSMQGLLRRHARRTRLSDLMSSRATARSPCTDNPRPQKFHNLPALLQRSKQVKEAGNKVWSRTRARPRLISFNKIKKTARSESHVGATSIMRSQKRQLRNSEARAEYSRIVLPCAIKFPRTSHWRRLLLNAHVPSSKHSTRTMS